MNVAGRRTNPFEALVMDRKLIALLGSTLAKLQGLARLDEPMTLHEFGDTMLHECRVSVLTAWSMSHRQFYLAIFAH